MRTLTIKRTKVFPGSAVTLKVYIEDPESDDLVINNMPCRKLGTLKNGEKAEFSVGEQAARIYVIADKLSKGFCNEYYKLPEGEEDIFLSGRCRFNLGSGNAFRFDGQTDPEVLAYRKKGTKKGLIVITASVLIGVLVGSGFGKLIGGNFSKGAQYEDKTFQSHGMQITLTEAFWEGEMEGYTVSFNSQKAMVFALQEKFTLVDGFGDYTLEEYGQLTLDVNGLSKTTQLQRKDGLIYFDFVRDVPGDMGEYYYLAVMLKTSDAFWLVQFATAVENKDDYQQDFWKWAKTIEFSKAI